MEQQLAIQTIIEQMPQVATAPETFINPTFIDPRDLPFDQDLIDTWADATSMWMMRWTNRNKRNKSFETVKVHARAWFDFFTYQFPVQPELTGMDQLARDIVAGDPQAMLKLDRLIRKVIGECYTQSLIAFELGRKTTIRAPWEIDTLDVQRWELALEQRTHTTIALVRGPRKSKKNPLGGNRKVSTEKKLSSESIAQRIAALSSYYIYVSQKHVITHADGGVRPVFALNPVQPLPRHEVFQYGKATALDGEQVTQLLRTVKANHSVTGLRDLALFTGFLYLGRRHSEIRELTWGDILEGGKQYQTRTKGKKDHFEKADLPKPVYNSIIAYLNSSGRLETIQPGDYLFIAHSDRAKHLKRRDGQPVVTADYAPGSSPVSSREVGRVLKKYGRKAGLDETKLHVHVLRHTAAMLRKAVGDQLEDISKMLGHANFNTTKIYLDHMEGHKDISWRKVEALIGLHDD
ncbi:MAG: tyrosine-type recombinase/integrase [Azonexus sp.]